MRRAIEEIGERTVFAPEGEPAGQVRAALVAQESGSHVAQEDGLLQIAKIGPPQRLFQGHQLIGGETLLALPDQPFQPKGAGTENFRVGNGAGRKPEGIEPVGPAF